jgi:hypothetical protein
MITLASLVMSLLAALAHRLHFGRKPAPRYRIATHQTACAIPSCDRADHVSVRTVDGPGYARLGNPTDVQR